MYFDTNKEKGKSGLAYAIGYFGTHGYTVSIPLNDTQDYDLLVEKNNLIDKISVKATSQRSEYNITMCDLRSSGGTNGGIYGRECNKNINFVFIVNECLEMWLVPKEIIPTSIISLGEKYKNYKIS